MIWLDLKAKIQKVLLEKTGVRDTRPSSGMLAPVFTYFLGMRPLEFAKNVNKTVIAGSFGEILKVKIEEEPDARQET